MSGAYDDLVRLLVPELQRRGLFQKVYAGPTLLDNLGLPIPAPPIGTRRADPPTTLGPNHWPAGSRLQTKIINLTGTK